MTSGPDRCDVANVTFVSFQDVESKATVNGVMGALRELVENFEWENLASDESGSNATGRTDTVTTTGGRPTVETFVVFGSCFYDPADSLKPLVEV